MGGQFTEFRRLLTVHGSVSFCTRNADFVLYFNVFICIKVIDVCLSMCVCVSVCVSHCVCVSVCVCVCVQRRIHMLIYMPRAIQMDCANMHVYMLRVCIHYYVCFLSLVSSC